MKTTQKQAKHNSGISYFPFLAPILPPKKLIDKYLLRVGHKENEKIYRSPAFQESISKSVKDLKPEEFLALFKIIERNKQSHNPHLSTAVNNQIDDLFAKDVFLIYLKNTLNLNRLGAGLHEIVLRQLEPLNKEQLRDLIQLMAQKNSPITSQEVCYSLQVLDNLKQQQKKVQTNKLIRNFAILGAVATLAFGGLRAETKEQKTATAAGTAALATLAVGAHVQKRKQQNQKIEEITNVQKYPEVFSRFQQIQKVINSKG